MGSEGQEEGLDLDARVDSLSLSFLTLIDEIDPRLEAWARVAAAAATPQNVTAVITQVVDRVTAAITPLMVNVRVAVDSARQVVVAAQQHSRDTGVPAQFVNVNSQLRPLVRTIEAALASLAQQSSELGRLDTGYPEYRPDPAHQP